MSNGPNSVFVASHLPQSAELGTRGQQVLDPFHLTTRIHYRKPMAHPIAYMAAGSSAFPIFLCRHPVANEELCTSNPFSKWPPSS
jgi:hypothetical protein